MSIDSDFADLLYLIESEGSQWNNVVLSREETAVAKRMIRADEKRIVELEGQISRVRLHLSRLRIVTAPHKIIPPEIIRKIFEFCALEQPMSYLPKLLPMRLPSAVWSMRHVCSRWRNAVLSSAIWNDIVVDELHTFTQPSRERWRFNFWKERIACASQPLSVESEHRGEEAQALHKFLIQPYHEHFRRLVLIGTRPFLLLPTGVFPLLETLELTFAQPYYSPDQCSHLRKSPCFAGMKSLRSLHILFEAKSVNSPDFPLPLQVPWAQLTSLKLIAPHLNTGLDITVLLEVLKQCSSLTRFHIDLRFKGSPPQNTMVSLPYLTSLTICEVASNSVPSFLNFVTASSLVVLRKMGPYDLAGVSSFILRSGCTLQAISLMCYFFSSVVPTFNSYQSQAAFDDGELVELLSGRLLPDLECLSLSLHNISQMDKLVELIEQRSTALTRDSPRLLRKVYVQLWAEWADNDSARIQKHLVQVLARGTMMRIRSHRNVILFQTRNWMEDIGNRIHITYCTRRGEEGWE